MAIFQLGTELKAAIQALINQAIIGIGGGEPSGPAGGVLSGTYPNPGFAEPMATQANLNSLSTVIDGKADEIHPHLSTDITDFQTAARNAVNDRAGAPVADLAALRGVAEADRQDKQMRFVESPGYIYRFDLEGSGADDNDGIISPTVGSGRWFKTSGGGSGNAETLEGFNSAYHRNVDNHIDGVTNRLFTDVLRQALLDTEQGLIDTDANLQGAYDLIWSHQGSFSNPHNVTKAQVGLTNVDNTSDANKPLSTASIAALALKQNAAPDAFTSLTDGATVTLATGGARFSNAKVTLGGNRTLSITGAVSGSSGLLIVTQDGTGSRTLTLPAGSKVVDGGSGTVVLSPAANAITILSWIYDGTNYFWSYGGNFN